MLEPKHHKFNQTTAPTRGTTILTFYMFLFVVQKIYMFRHSHDGSYTRQTGFDEPQKEFLYDCKEFIPCYRPTLENRQTSCYLTWTSIFISWVRRTAAQILYIVWTKSWYDVRTQDTLGSTNRRQNSSVIVMNSCHVTAQR